ncbi:MAG TPA: hypothetical protein DCQ34_00340, partial [Chitinophagaceae bacterium]|nr:hypothetical protein [Chitinophagaceae bacterium]
RLGHALLFLGKEGNGALALAIAFAQYLVCEKVQGISSIPPAALLFDAPEPVTADVEPMFDSCGECPACQKAAKWIHPDIHFTYPTITKKPNEKPIAADYATEWRNFLKTDIYGNSFDWLQTIGAENQQGNITSRECHEIIRKMSLKSFEAPFKILIMWMPEYLDKEGNILLKLIEEPPANSLFILVSEQESKLLPTILSRLQLIKVPRLKPIDIEASLELKEGCPPTEAASIAAIADGNYREALHMLKHADDDWEPWIKSWLNDIFRNAREAQMKWVDEVQKLGRERQKLLLKQFLQLIEMAIRVKISGTAGPANAENELKVELAGKLEKKFDAGQLEAIARELSDASYYIERNANAKMLFTALTIKLYYIITNKSVILVN